MQTGAGVQQQLKLVVQTSDAVQQLKLVVQTSDAMLGKLVGDQILGAHLSLVKNDKGLGIT